ncbi:MAG TPA: STAS domain-containing protein [Vicinamibacterales bacterium]|nr:STAS domain-containing protein [Vicinamibacterales bacterium]
MTDDLFGNIEETPSKLHIDERRTGDVTVLALSGEMLVDDGDVALRQRIHELIEQGRVKLLIDLAAVTHLDSACVGMIVAKQKSVRDHGGDLKLVHLTSRSQRLLALMKIVSVFEAFDDEETAVRSFGS